MDSGKEEPRQPHAATQGLVGRLAFPAAFVAVGLVVAALFASILRINSGTFVYTLDDPYIHLALSDQIRHGNYGLYPGTHAAPSSSILFPVLLATLSGTPLHPYFPLLLNILGLFFTVEVLRRFLLRLGFARDDFSTAIQAAILFLMALCFNVIGVVFTGLEHSLHIATVAALVYGLVIFLEQDKLPPWLPAVIVLCPLLRYEGLAPSAGAILVLALRGRWRVALFSFAAIVALVGGFSFFLHRLGLPLLPSSVLSKSAVAAGGVNGMHAGFLSGLIDNVHIMVSHPTGIVLLLSAVVALCVCIRSITSPPHRWNPGSLMALFLAVILFGHAAGGEFGWLDRYEDYIVVAWAMVSLYLAKDFFCRVFESSTKDRWLFLFATTACSLILGARYCYMSANTPHTSNNIYEQQLQMHRFIVNFWQSPVAVNDLGLASYHNPWPVLDLGGLGSEKARLLMASDASADDYEALVAASNIHLVIIYDEWFPGRVPDAWQKVGTLSLSRSHISAAHSDVQFYATDRPTAAKVRAELLAFKNTLPPRVGLTMD